MIAMTLLSDVCADLGDAERAALLYDSSSRTPTSTW